MEINDQRLKMYFYFFPFFVVISFDDVIFLFFLPELEEKLDLLRETTKTVLLKDELKWEKRVMPMGNVWNGFEILQQNSEYNLFCLNLEMFEMLQPSRFIPIDSLLVDFPN